MATFTYTPDFGASKKSAPRVRVVNFGDGYEQRVASGININLQEWSLSFSNRSDTEINAIDSFLMARNATETFDWQPYGGVSGKYVCREWSKSIDGYERNSIQAVFTEVAEP